MNGVLVVIVLVVGATVLVGGLFKNDPMVVNGVTYRGFRRWSPTDRQRFRLYGGWTGQDGLKAQGRTGLRVYLHGRTEEAAWCSDHAGNMGDCMYNVLTIEFRSWGERYRALLSAVSIDHLLESQQVAPKRWHDSTNGPVLR